LFQKFHFKRYVHSWEIRNFPATSEIHNFSQSSRPNVCTSLLLMFRRVAFLELALLPLLEIQYCPFGFFGVFWISQSCIQTTCFESKLARTLKFVIFYFIEFQEFLRIAFEGPALKAPLEIPCCPFRFFGIFWISKSCIQKPYFENKLLRTFDFGIFYFIESFESLRVACKERKIA
jgi:hypothetical protein